MGEERTKHARSALRKAIFENQGCTNDDCHGSARSGGLDLRAGASYGNLIDVPDGSLPDQAWKRVDPGNDKTSLLWVNLAARTLPDSYAAPLRGMPLGLPPISTDELEALRLWIVNGGAARDANVAAAASLLNACVPEPKPAKIEPLPPPRSRHRRADAHAGLDARAAQRGRGVLLELLRPERPDPRRVPQRRRPTLPLQADRHSPGPSQPSPDRRPVPRPRGRQRSGVGVYKCRAGERDGEVCDPLDLPFCGSGQCATDPDPDAIACIGFGPQTGLNTLTQGGLAFAQATTATYRFPAQVYDEMPVRGVVLWNSHAFNLTDTSGTLEGWVNILFPAATEQIYQETRIFNVSKIFWRDLSNLFPLRTLAPFEEMEICNVHEFGPHVGLGESVLNPGETAHLFELSGHTHEHGVRFQILRGRFTCTGGPNAGVACSPFQPEMCPAAACVDDGGRDPQQALLYTNYVYNDPVVVRFDDDPILISGSAPLADRTLTYCAHYDNGVAPNIDKVKRRSTSPPAGVIFDVFSVGGPCDASQTRCIGGPRHNELCNGSDAFCESGAGAGDGDCDACPLTGGFRTQDEMFVLFGDYWVTKD